MAEIIKMYAIFCRETLQKMQFEGKLAAQAGHCYLHAWWDAEDRLMWRDIVIDVDADATMPDLTPYYLNVMEPYRNGNDARKIALVVDTVQELEDLYYEFRDHMGATFVEDCAYTVFEEPTITGIGLGPIPSDWTKGTKLEKISTLKNEIK